MSRVDAAVAMASPWQSISGGITAPEGFLAAGVASGLKASGKPDLGLLLAPEAAVCAGTFTQSVVRAACVDLCAERLKGADGRARAVVVNSGQANACTGDRGLVDSLRATQAVADHLGLDPDEVLICSTGVIGVPIPMPTLLAGLDPLIAALTADGRSCSQGHSHHRSGGQAGGCGGGSGGAGCGLAVWPGRMIHPDMATMLFFSCDAGVDSAVWGSCTRGAAFLQRHHGGWDTSTNDVVLAFAAGEPRRISSRPWKRGSQAMQHLAQAIARDGRGDLLIEVQVEVLGGAAALQVARTVCGSSLVKTAVHGRDPNWGRIVAAAGRSGVAFDPDSVALWIGSHQLMAGGQPLAFDRSAASEVLKQERVLIRLSLGVGSGSGLAWGYDLSDQYVRINADYTT